MSKKLCLPWGIPISCQLSKTLIFPVFVNNHFEKISQNHEKLFSGLEYRRSAMQGPLHAVIPPKVTWPRNFSKTNTFHSSPVYTKFRERKKPVLPSFLPLSSRGERMKEVQELGVWNQWTWAWVPALYLLALQSRETLSGLRASVSSSTKWE